MNISRAGTPIQANKPGLDKRVDDKMGTLLEQQATVELAIGHYAKKIELNDWWQKWYERGLEMSLDKLDKIKHEMKNATGYKEPEKEIKNEFTTGEKASTVVAGNGKGQVPLKEKGPEAKK